MRDKTSDKQSRQTPEQIFETLVTVADQLSVKVRFETLPPGGVLNSGGLCRVRGQWTLIIDKKATPAERVSVMVDALERFDTDALDLTPRVRELVRGRKGPISIAAASEPAPLEA